MLAIDKLIKEEKDIYGKLFVDLNLDQELTEQFLSEDESKQRTYIVKRDILENYISLMEHIENYNSSHMILKYVKSFSNARSIKRYKSINFTSLVQLSECSKCICLHCDKNCLFKSCLGCSDNSYITNCDKATLNVRAHQKYVVGLQNNTTMENGVFNVLYTLKDCRSSSMFIVLKSPKNVEQIILDYFPSSTGDTYGEVKDSAIFDKIVSILKVII